MTRYISLSLLPLFLAACVDTADTPEIETPTAAATTAAPIVDEDGRYVLKVSGIYGQSFPDIYQLWTDAIVEVCGNTLINPYSLTEILERDALGRAIPTLQGTVSCREG